MHDDTDPGCAGPYLVVLTALAAIAAAPVIVWAHPRHTWPWTITAATLVYLGTLAAALIAWGIAEDRYPR